MNFLSPAFLIGLPLVAVPVIIHLLNRRQQKKISWGAMRFLLQAATRRRRLWRLTDILLLILRTLAFLFFIFALTRPLLPVTWLGGSVPREVILVLDQSLSMSRQSGGESLFQWQIEKAHQVLNGLGGGDMVRVLLAGESPEWLGDGPVPATLSALRRLHSQLDALKPTLGKADLIGCLREAADMEPPPNLSARLIHVISDGRRFGWRLEDGPLWASLQSSLHRTAIPTTVRIELAEATPPGANLAIDKLEAPRPFGALGQTLTLTASVKNHGPKRSTSALLTWRVDDQEAGVSTVPELEPGASVALAWDHLYATKGARVISGILDSSDDLAGDNQARLVVEIFEHLPVLIVEDQPGTNTTEHATPFILAALGGVRPGSNPSNQGAVEEWRSVFEPTLIESAALEKTPLNPFHCVLLANPGRLNPAQVKTLESYVESGGGLWIALGPQTDEAFMNEGLYRGGLGLLPLKLTGAVGDAEDRERHFPVRAASDSHRATTLLADVQRLDLDRARLYRRHQFDPASGRDVSVLLQGSGGEPIAVERAFGRGRVLVQGVPLGVSWSSLPLCQAYVPWIHEWCWYLSEPNLPKRNLDPGEAMIESAPGPGSKAVLTLPDQRTVDLPAEPAHLGGRFRFAGTRLPGAYLLHIDPGASASKTTPLEVRRTPLESELKPWTDEDRQWVGAMKEFDLGDGTRVAEATGTVAVPKHPLEGWLLGALACVILGELVLAGWLSSRRGARVQPVSMEA